MHSTSTRYFLATLSTAKNILYISKRTDSTPLRLPNICPPNLSLLGLLYTPTTVLDSLTEQAGKRLGEQMFGRRRGDAICSEHSLTNIYSLDWSTVSRDNNTE